MSAPLPPVRAVADTTQPTTAALHLDFVGWAGINHSSQRAGLIAADDRLSGAQRVRWRRGPAGNRKALGVMNSPCLVVLASRAALGCEELYTCMQRVLPGRCGGLGGRPGRRRRRCGEQARAGPGEDPEGPPLVGRYPKPGKLQTIAGTHACNVGLSRRKHRASAACGVAGRRRRRPGLARWRRRLPGCRGGLRDVAWQ